MTSVYLQHISKHFGATKALDDIDLKINAGELFFLLGPSGCGKSTLLRLIAGLHEPTDGRIFFNDRDVTSLGTEKRKNATPFPTRLVESDVPSTLSNRVTSGNGVDVPAPVRMLRVFQLCC